MLQNKIKVMNQKIEQKVKKKQEIMKDIRDMEA